MRKWAVCLILCLVVLCFAVGVVQAESKIFGTNAEELIMAVGDAEQLTIQYDDAETDFKKAGFLFVSGDESVVTVSAKGRVKAIAEGNSSIRVISKYDMNEYVDIPVTVFIPAKRIKVSIADKDILNGETTQVVWEILPAEATYRKVSFVSSRETVATVDENGVVTGIAKGNAVITVISEDGLAEGKVNVKVRQRPETVEITAKTDICVVGRKLQLKASVKPSNTENRKVIWYSENEDIAKVSSSGMVQALKSGDATITAVSDADGSVKGSMVVHCAQLASSISFDGECYFVMLHDTIQLYPQVLPENTTNKAVKYRSSNKYTCDVDENGRVTAVGSGSVTITATTCDGSNRSTKVKIQVITPVTGVSYNRDGVRVGVSRHTTVTAKLEPEKATNKSMTWTSSDESIAVVSGKDNRVRISGRAWGRATITGVTEDGGYTVTFHANVGSLREAIKVVKVDVRNDRPYLTLRNVSNMIISKVYYEMYGLNSNNERIELSTKPDKTILIGEYGRLYPGETTSHGQFDFINYRKDHQYWDLQTLYFAITGFDTEDGYYDSNGAICYTYRINRENLNYIPSK